MIWFNKQADGDIPMNVSYEVTGLDRQIVCFMLCRVKSKNTSRKVRQLWWKVQRLFWIG